MKPSDLLSSIWQVLQGIMEDAGPRLAKFGLYPRSFFLLDKVRAHPYPAELAELLFLPPPTVSFIVKQLEKQGFLIREMDRGDRRRFRLSVTESGESALKLGRTVIDGSMRERMLKLTREELVQLKTLLMQMTEGGA